VEAEYRNALAINQKLVDDNPSVTHLQSDLAANHHGLGQVMHATGRLAEAEAQYRTAIAISQKATERSPAVAQYRLFLANHHHNLGIVLQAMGRPAEAEAEYRGALAIYQKLADSDFAVTQFRANLAVGHRTLGQLLLTTGKLTEAEPEFRKALALDATDVSSRSGIDVASRLAEVQAKLPALLKGEFQPANNRERLALAELCLQKKLYRTSVTQFAAAFTADPSVAGDRQAGYRYNAACAAALAASGKSRDEPVPDHAAKTLLREQARAWLETELAVWANLLESAAPERRKAIAQTLNHWRNVDPDLAGIRDDAAVSKLPDAERTKFRKLWKAVDELLAKSKGQ
jgi:tetratricopeptide (TPR) repeat protein